MSVDDSGSGAVGRSRRSGASSEMERIVTGGSRGGWIKEGCGGGEDRGSATWLHDELSASGNISAAICSGKDTVDGVGKGAACLVTSRGCGISVGDGGCVSAACINSSSGTSV